MEVRRQKISVRESDDLSWGTNLLYAWGGARFGGHFLSFGGACAFLLFLIVVRPRFPQLVFF